MWLSIFYQTLAMWFVYFVSSEICITIYSKQGECAGHVARMGRGEAYAGFW